MRRGPAGEQHRVRCQEERKKRQEGENRQRYDSSVLWIHGTMTCTEKELKCQAHPRTPNTAHKASGHNNVQTKLNSLYVEHAQTKLLSFRVVFIAY